MKYPQWDENASDAELIKEFYGVLIETYQESDITEEIKENGDLVHVVMGAVQQYAENLCAERKMKKAKECFELLNTFFCRSKHELLNAFNVSFLEYFAFHDGLSEKEFKDIMPEAFYKGYTEMITYMENLAKQAELNPKNPKT